MEVQKKGQHQNTKKYSQAMNKYYSDMLLRLQILLFPYKNLSS